MELGILKFNVKPKKGLGYLFENGIIEKTPEAVSRLFKTRTGMDRVQMGDWIGEPGEFNKAVLQQYITELDFTDTHFDKALRAFLSTGFRLPGEPEKIDRMMEKFAEQYCKHNPGIFANADQAYVLAYAVIMLNTDAHSSQIRDRMTQQQFIRNSNEGDLDVEFLKKIYDRIVNDEIKMKDDPLAITETRSTPIINPKKRNYIFMKESQQMVKRTQELIKGKKDKGKKDDEETKLYKWNPISIKQQPKILTLLSPCLKYYGILVWQR